MAININPLPIPNFPWRPTSSVQPFTYKDGMSYLQILERLRGYVTKTLVPAIQEEIENFEEDVENNFATLVEYVNAAIEQIINNSITLQDAVMAGIINSESVTRGILDDLYQPKVYIDPVRDFGAVGDGITDDTVALQNAINAIPTSGGAVLLPGKSFKITDTLVFKSNTQLIGIASKSSTLLSNMDKPSIRAMGGEGQVIRNIRVSNTFTGARTTYDVVFVSPTKPVLDFVEINLPNGNLAKGGVSFIKDTAVPGNSFMPELNNVWIRNGHLYVEGVTDGHFNGGWVWAPSTNAPASIEMRAVSDGWTFQGVDVVPTVNAGYYFNQCNNENVIGGYLDGGRPEFLLGHGIHAVSSGRITLTGFMLYTSGKSGIRFENTNGCNISALRFINGNKRDGSFPDIELVNSSYNNFVNTEHASWRDRINKGEVYKEDSTSSSNNFDYAIIDTTQGNQYASPIVSANPNTMGEHCKPFSLFPQPTKTPRTITTPGGLMVGMATAVVWSAANRALFHRFNVSDQGTYRYVNVRVEAGSGNIQACIVRLNNDGTYTRVADSGIIPCTTGMSASIDVGATALAPGDYAAVVWLDNNVATLRVGSDEMLRATRQLAEVSSLVGGVPASGAIPTWNGSRGIGGLTVSLASS